MNWNKLGSRRIFGYITFAILLFLLLWNYSVVWQAIKLLGGIVTPFILGGAIAFILNVPMGFLERKLFRDKFPRLRRPLSLVITILLLIAIIILVVFVVAPQLGTTFAKLADNVQTFMPQFSTYINELFHNNAYITEWLGKFDFQKIIDAALTFVKTGTGIAIDSVFTIAKGFISGVTSFVIGFVFACYILLQKEKLGEQAHRMIHAYISAKHASRLLYICSLTYRTFANFITGQCIEAIILGSMFFVSMSICRLPYALLVGLLIAVTALIPIFGAFIGCAVGAFLILMVSPYKALFFIILFLVLQQIEGNLIYPKVVGGSIGLPSIWVLVAVSIGGSLMGILGMLVFIPAISVAYTLLQENMRHRLSIKDQHPHIASAGDNSSSEN